MAQGKLSLSLVLSCLLFVFRVLISFVALFLDSRFRDYLCPFIYLILVFFRNGFAVICGFFFPEWQFDGELTSILVFFISILSFFSLVPILPRDIGLIELNRPRIYKTLFHSF